MSDIFNLSDETLQTSHFHQGLMFSLLFDEVRTIKIAKEPNWEILEQGLKWFESINLSKLIQTSTPFFWLNIQRFLTEFDRNLPDFSVKIHDLLMTGFDSQFFNLPEEASCTLPVTDNSCVVFPCLGIQFYKKNTQVQLRKIDSNQLEVNLVDDRKFTFTLKEIPLENQLPVMTISESARLILSNHSALFEEGYRQQIKLNLSSPQNHTEMLTESLNTIRAIDPSLGTRIATQIHWYVPIDRPNVEVHSSFTSARLRGVSFLSEATSLFQLMEGIVHEYYHDSLFIVMSIQDVFSHYPKHLLYSPWREDPRPIDKLFHALYVFSGLANFLARAEDFSHLLSTNKNLLRLRRLEILQRLILGFVQIPLEYLTPFGQELLSDIKEIICYHKSDLEVNCNKLMPQIIEHLQKWCKVHPDLASYVQYPAAK